MTAAVRFNASVAGAHFAIDGQQYVICEPTFKGYMIGETTPENINGYPEIIRIKK
jgi:hypothetical protein